ncbi:MAG: RNase adapter RapZ [Chloroflexota bacterium]
MGKRVLITGMSGTGKSTAIERLGVLGYKAVDTDHPDWYALDDAGERIWREAKISALLDNTPADSALFVSGTFINQGKFYPKFDHVVLFSAPLTVIVERLRTRTNNPFGKHPDEFAAVRADIEMVEPLLRRSADVEIDTSVSIDVVVAQLVGLLEV